MRHERHLTPRFDARALVVTERDADATAVIGEFTQPIVEVGLLLHRTSRRPGAHGTIHGLVNPDTPRDRHRATSFSTYFATTSTSRLTRVPAAAQPSVVRSSVSGISDTSNVSSSIRAMVSETPSTAIEPFSTT
jgi:hypothetical protein